MRDVNRITSAAPVLLGVGIALGLGLGAASGCASNKKEVAEAKRSLFDTDFAVVYSAALEATRKLYPNIDDNPGNGAIKTAWHQVQYATDPSQDTAGRTISTNSMGMSGMGTAGTSPAAGAAGMPTRLAYKRYYVRFDVSVVGGRPWRLKIVGHASSWEPGAAMPTELRGPAKPAWLDPRVDALRLAIFQKVKPYAVAMKEEATADRDKEVVTDPKVFTGVPPATAKVLAHLKDTLVKRDYAALRADLADDVVWNAGQAPGAETAMAMWQADPEAFETMGKLIAAGCGQESEQRVTCPTTAPAIGQWQLALEPRGGTWRVTSFVRAE